MAERADISSGEAQPEPVDAVSAGSRIRVAIVAPTLRKKIGGPEVQAELLLRGWADDHTVNAAFVPTNEPLPNLLERLPYVRTVLRFPRYLFLLWRALGHAEIAHVFSSASWSFRLATLPAYALARLRRKRVIIHYHSAWGEVHLRSSPLARAVLRHADLTIVPSSYYVDLFRRFRIVAREIPNIVDHLQFPRRYRTPLKPVLLSPRNLEHYCGVDRVVRAFAEVQRQIPDASLTIVGVGPHEGAIRDLITKLKLRHVRFVGEVPHQEMGKVYDEADILVNASRVDNMPVSIMEAFSSGLPVVTTNTGGIAYFVEHDRTGLVSEPDDWHALAENVQRLTRTPGLADKLTYNAHEQAFQYRWDPVKQQWLDAYRSAL